MWRSVLVAVIVSALLVCTESGGNVSGPAGDVPEEQRVASVALRLYARTGSTWVLQDRTASVTRIVLLGDGARKTDTVYVPVGNDCRLTYARPTSTSTEIQEWHFVSGSDTLIDL